MNIHGHIYGVILNDTEERACLAPAFHENPYKAAPKAPVVYLKPASALARGMVALDQRRSVTAATTVALLFGHDASRVGLDRAFDHVAACALAIDLSWPETDYYRPAVALRNADGFLSLAAWGAPVLPDAIALDVDGQQAHAWTLDRLVRPVAQLIADLAAFMTLRAGDVLLVGLPGDAPCVAGGHTITARATGMASVSTRLEYAA